MGSRRDAASVIFNLPGYRVIDAVDLPLGGRRVRVQPVDLDDGCPSCGVISARGACLDRAEGSATFRTPASWRCPRTTSYVVLRTT